MEQIVYQSRSHGIAIDRIRREAAFSMPCKHLHDEYEIYYLLEGERYYFIDRKTYHVTKGSLVFIDRGQIHQTSQAGLGSHERILLSLKEHPFSEFLSFTGELSLQSFFHRHSGILHLNQEAQSYVESLFAAASRELKEKKPGFLHMAMGELSRLFIFASRLFPDSDTALPLSTQPKHRKVEEAASYMIDHFNENLSLDSVARKLYVNKCYLSRIFKEASGFTVNEYINMIRIRKARELLSSTSLTVTEVADAVGYDTITYFERVFRQYTLTSPSSYRKSKNWTG